MTTTQTILDNTKLETRNSVGAFTIGPHQFVDDEVTNTAGQNLIFKGGNSTGNAAGGDIVFQCVQSTGASGTTANTSDAVLTIDGSTGDITVTSNIILANTPSNDNHLANKSYVDSVAEGLSVKDSVRVATTAAGTLATSFANGETIDGIELVTGDRILIKNQSSGDENGIYVVTAGTPTRADDLAVAASGDTDAAGVFVFVEEGTTNADSGFVCSSDTGSARVGTDNLSFTQFSGAGSITAGDGLDKTGNTLSVNVDDSTIEISSDTLQVKEGGIDTAELAAESVTNDKLAGSIANSKLVNDSVSFGGIELALGASDPTPAFDLTDATNYPTSSLSGTITNAQLAGSIENGKLVNDSVTIGTTEIDLGSSATELTGVTSIACSSSAGLLLDCVDSDSGNSGITLGDGLAVGFRIIDDSDNSYFSIKTNASAGDRQISMLDVTISNGTISAASITCSSDETLKTNIKTIEGQTGLSKLNQIRPISWNWKEGDTKSTRMGVSAQQLASILPDSVVTGSTGKLSVNYNDLFGILISSVQELSKQIKQQ